MTPNSNIMHMLSPLGCLYGRIMSLRNAFYNRGYLKTHWLAAPTIAIGNITTGGTGKTPTVVFLANLLRDMGLHPGIIMRGYAAKSESGLDSDELLLYRRLLSDVPVVANPDRLIAGRGVLEQNADVILADDAFQHRRLGRDFNLCLIDAVSPFGGGKILPAGHLREPLKGLARADLFIVTRVDQVSQNVLDEIRSHLEHFAPHTPILTASHRPGSLSDISNRKIPLASLAGRKIFAFAAIGRPEAFFATLKSLGADILDHRRFRDHHRFTVEDLFVLRDNAKNLSASALVCTAKDLVKFTPEMLAQAGLPTDFVLALDIDIAMSAADKNLLSEKLFALTKNFSRQTLAAIH
jgi:tetraacyldisaccharide 4'-kinase